MQPRIFHTSNMPLLKKTWNLSNVLHRRDSNRFQYVNCDTKLRKEDVLLICFEQIVSFFAFIYSNTNSYQLFCENSKLNLANSIKLVVFLVNFLENFTPAKEHFTQVSLVTNSISAREVIIVAILHWIHISHIK